MSGCLYILTGASGCGKTTLLNSVCSGALQKKYSAVKAPKYSERSSRGPDDDIETVERVELGAFDLAYVINGIRYGIRIRDIEVQIEAGKNSFIILSDFRIVRRLKAMLHHRAKAIYIASSVDTRRIEAIQEARYGFNPDPKQRKRLQVQFSRLESAARLGLWRSVFECMGELANDWREFIPEAKSTEIRAQKIRAFHNRYIDNLHLFDHVLLNYNQGHPEEMTEQLVNILKCSSTRRPRINSRPVLFVVAASSGAGKGTLMETLNMIGRDQVAIVTKMARRDPKTNDRRDGMVAIGKDGVFPEVFDMHWTFHEPMRKPTKRGRRELVEAGDGQSDRREMEKYAGTEYAIGTKEVRDNFERGVQQIVISNMKQFPRFRELFGEKVVFLYLHRLVSAKEIRRFQLENCETKDEALQRIFEIREVHKDYMKKIAEFDHVLLNTAYREDLFDQMFQLIDFYR